MTNSENIKEREQRLKELEEKKEEYRNQLKTDFLKWMTQEEFQEALKIINSGETDIADSPQSIEKSGFVEMLWAYQPWREAACRERNRGLLEEPSRTFHPERENALEYTKLLSKWMTSEEYQKSLEIIQSAKSSYEMHQMLWMYPPWRHARWEHKNDCFVENVL
ncbi:MAG: hypothetical protein Q4D98_14365 [Planctomycetia bacterium]|nr:hypothetical protein [Planctomycetia bacterium]